jgi:hypothetical protein
VFLIHLSDVGLISPQGNSRCPSERDAREELPRKKPQLRRIPVPHNKAKRFEGTPRYSIREDLKSQTRLRLKIGFAGRQKAGGMS